MQNHPLKLSKCVTVLLAAIAYASVARADTIFSDNFNSGASPDWNGTNGNWIASGGVYYAQQPSNNPTTYAGLPFNVSDFEIVVDINSIGDGGIWLRTDGSNQNGILLVTGGDSYGAGARGGYAGTELYWHIVSNGNYSSPTNIAYGVLIPGNNYALTLTVRGDTYKAYVNGTLETTLVDSTYSHGDVGLYDYQPGPGGFGPPQTFDNFYLASLPAVLGDANDDGVVNTTDLGILMQHMGQTVAGGYSVGDFNNDGQVNRDDLALYQLGAAEYDQSIGLPVPEPIGSGFAAIMALVLLPRRRAALCLS
ncbi:MAG TPA: dockerin type I domain-containing protein [Tepidisphaeraceae bacterium]